MKTLFSKIMVVITGATALFGISAANVTASIPDVSEKSLFYLEHGKSIAVSADTLGWHSSHASHASHGSHSSHGSHASHGSGW